jgi:hypothetical protein
VTPRLSDQVCTSSAAWRSGPSCPGRPSPRPSLGPDPRPGIVEYQVRQTPTGAEVLVIGAPGDPAGTTRALDSELARLGSQASPWSSASWTTCNGSQRARSRAFSPHLRQLGHGARITKATHRPPVVSPAFPAGRASWNRAVRATADTGRRSHRCSPSPLFREVDSLTAAGPQPRCRSSVLPRRPRPPAGVAQPACRRAGHARQRHRDRSADRAPPGPRSTCWWRRQSWPRSGSWPRAAR